jgi:hypothetical protein
MASSSSGGNKTLLWGGILTVVALVVAPLGLIAFIVLVAAGGAQACQPGAAAPSSSELSTEQAQNAATIIGVSKSAFTDPAVQQKAQMVALIAALQESGLRNLDHGDADSLGLFQMRPSMGWGTPAQVQNPAYAAGMFFRHLVDVSGWEAMAPGQAAQAVEVSAFPDAYAKWIPKATAVINELAPTIQPIAIPADVGWGGASQGDGAPAAAAQCPVSGDARALADELVKAIEAGKLYGTTPDHLKEIRWMAEGKTVANCQIDTRILQIAVAAVRAFDRVGISDINRKCTGQVEGAGTDSLHYKDGGGHAIDFFAINGQALTGANPPSLELIRALDAAAPADAMGLGQRQCRMAAHTQISLTHFVDFNDSCNHVHVDVGRSNL